MSTKVSILFVLSHQFISLPQFLSHLDNDLERWNNCSSCRLISQLLSHHRKNLKQQTSYSSVRAQTDGTFIKQTADSTLPRRGSKLTLKEWWWSLLGSLFILPVFSSWFCLLQKANGYMLEASQGRVVCLGICKIRLLHIHLCGCGLRFLIDGWKLHNNRLYCACLSHNSVCCNRRCVCIEYLWTLQGSWLPKVTWHSCAPRMHTLMLEKSLRLFCRISVNTPGLHWGMSGMRLRHQLESFSGRPALLAYA